MLSESLTRMKADHSEVIHLLSEKQTQIFSSMELYRSFILERAYGKKKAPEYSRAFFAEDYNGFYRSTNAIKTIIHIKSESVSRDTFTLKFTSVELSGF